MSIAAVTKMWSQTSSELVRDDQQQNTLTVKGAFQVLHTADTLDIDIRNAPGVYAMGEFLDGTQAVCKNKSVEKAGPTLSIVKYSGTSLTGPNGEEDPPVNMLPQFNYRSISSEEETEIDANGRLLVNTAGEKVRGLMRTIHDMELVIKRNFLAVNATTALQYLDSVNSDTINVFGDSWAPGQAALQDFDISPVYNEDNIIGYFSVDARIVFRQAYNTTPDRAWWYRYPSEGMRQYGVDVTFSGGTGTGAAGYAYTDNDGNVDAVVITDGGRGYTVAPSISIGGGGSGFTGTVNIDTDLEQVVSVTITNNGTNYESRLIPCLDGNKQPVTSPVFLSRSGRQVKDGGDALIIERPRKVFKLPYSALGLI